jgi:hypothetical protein
MSSNGPNKASEPAITAVTICAPSSTARASRDRGSSLTLGKKMKAVLLLASLTVLHALSASEAWQVIDDGFRFRLPREWTKIPVRGYDSHVGQYRASTAVLEFDEVTAYGESVEKTASYIESLKKKEADASLRTSGEEIWRVDGRIATVTFGTVDPKVYGKREFPLVASMSVPYPGEPAGLGVRIFYSSPQEEALVRSILRSFQWPKKPNKAPEPTPGAVTPRATERASK